MSHMYITHERYIILYVVEKDRGLGRGTAQVRDFAYCEGGAVSEGGFWV